MLDLLRRIFQRRRLHSVSKALNVEAGVPQKQVSNKAAELETRFREALASGKITGDILTTDEDGSVVRSVKNTNIFDL